jgi:hypothetical protein
MKNVFTVLLFCYFPVIVYAADTQNWQLVLAEDPLEKHTSCLMVSATKQNDDGQATTPVSLIYNGKVFIAKTKSNIDLSYPNLGLQVDNKKPHNIDHLHKNNSVVFETQSPQILGEFIKGLTGKLTLGFWPTWPKTRSFTIDFDLRGFTKIYRNFQHCQKTGEIL